MPKAGRPPLEPTPEQRRTVEEMSMCGIAQDRIAKVIGCSSRTLRSRFRGELAAGGDRLRAEVIAGLFAAAGKGNVAALKRLEELARLAEASMAPKAVAPAGVKATAAARAKAVAASGRFRPIGVPALGKRLRQKRPLRRPDMARGGATI